MIFRNPKARKTIALFLLINMMNFTLFPTVSWALTSGPTAPEYSSFEPVDTTDMINLPTGDFTYSTPVLNVPGASGGYPLSLSYHAGIQTNQDASWVGLGWTLNPGAINRTVNGFPDDYKDTSTSNRKFWEGGETTTTTFTVSKLVGGGNASYSMSFSNDTYRGVSRTSSYGFSKGPLSFLRSNGKTSVGLNGQIPLLQTALGPINLTGGVSQNSKGEFTKSIGFSYDSKFLDNDKTSNLGLNPSMASMQISMSSNGSSSVSIGSGGGSFNFANNKSGNVSVNSRGFTTPKIPIFQTGLALQISYQYQRYWIDEFDSKWVNGSLYNRINLNMDDYASDVLELNDLDINPTSYAGTKQQKASFLNYDSYTVTGQGVGGYMRPHNYQTALSRQNVIEIKANQEDKYLVKSLDVEGVSKPFHFRFIGDNSNRFINNSGSFTQSGSNLSFNYSTGYTTSNDEVEPNFGFNETTNNLAGSQFIEYYTNAEINNAQVGTTSIIDCEAPGFVRSNDNLIGGYSITNSSGVKYHYMLPVYTSEEKIFSGKIDQLDKYSFSYDKKNKKYAYSWLISGITGPDYVDRGPTGEPDGLLNDFDWGYWVKFEHGKWTDSYRWRNPSEGSHKGLDRNSDFISTGIKEIYYLNKIVTNTHTAIFVKDTRFDGKGVTSEKDELVVTVNKTVTYVDDGGFSYKRKTFDYATEDYYGNATQRTHYYDEAPISTQKLSGIYLVKNSNLPENIKSLNDINHFEFFFEYDDGLGNMETSPVFFNQLGKNIIDEGDLALLPATFYEKVVSGIKLNFDYSLAKNTPNSFVSKLDALESSAVENTNLLLGKLSLKSVNFLSHGRANLIPQVKFNYAYNPDYIKDAYDIWGHYKSNYVDQGDEDESRFTNPNESHAWSLSQINTSAGAAINVEYEDDTYQAIYNKLNVVKIKNAVVIDESNEIVKLELYQKTTGMKINVGDELKINGLIRRKVSIPWFDNISAYREAYYWKRLGLVTVKITNIQSNAIIVKKKLPGNGLAFWLSNEIVLSYNIGSCTNVAFGTGSENKVSSDPIFQAGYFTLDTESVIGGGIRVKDISVSTLSNTQVTSYTYLDGKTTYEPKGIGINLKPFEEDLNDFKPLAECIRAKEIEVHKKFKEKYYKNVLGDFSKIVNYVNEIPGPSVYYGSVEVRSSFNGNLIPEYSKFSYYPFEKESIGLINGDPTNGKPIIGGASFSGNRTIEGQYIEDNIGYSTVLTNQSKPMGTIKSIASYNDQGIILVKKSFGYNMSSDDFLNNQGTIEESFAEAIQVYNEDQANYDLERFYTKRITKSNFLTNVVETNYKTGITQTSENLAFDFYSGQATKVLTTDGYGNAFVSETTPAYRVTKADGTRAYPSMGLKVGNSNNFNMLTQEGSSVTYKINPTNYTPISLLSAGVQTWNDTWTYKNADNTEFTTGVDEKVWRKHKTYNWVGTESLNSVNVADDGTYNWTTYDANKFTGWLASGSDPAGWQKNSEVTLYDAFSHALEAKDVNGNYAATKMDSKNEYVFASVANASYNEFAYSGAEDEQVNGYFGGQVSTGGTVVSTNVHTGTKGVLATYSSTGIPNTPLFQETTQRGFVFTSNSITPNRTYRVSVWSSKSLGKIKYMLNGGLVKTAILKPIEKAGGWALLAADIPTATSTTTLKVWCESSIKSTVFDDFRVHPIDAAMISYVYNKWGEVSYILNANNLYTKFEYDDAGKLKATYSERIDYGEQQVSSNKMSYALDDVPSLNNMSAMGIQNLNTVIKTGASSSFKAEGLGLTSGRTYTYQWDFGNGRTSTVAQPSVTFTNVGFRYITLKTTDNYGNFKEVAKRITVRNCPANGTEKSRICETINDRNTGNVIIKFHNGNCGYYTNVIYNTTECPTSGGGGGPGLEDIE